MDARVKGDTRGMVVAVKAGVDALNSHFRNSGWVQPDGATIVNVDNRRVDVFMQEMSTPALRLLMQKLTEDELQAALAFIAERRGALELAPSLA